MIIISHNQLSYEVERLFSNCFDHLG